MLCKCLLEEADRDGSLCSTELWIDRCWAGCAAMVKIEFRTRGVSTGKLDCWQEENKFTLMAGWPSSSRRRRMRSSSRMKSSLLILQLPIRGYCVQLSLRLVRCGACLMHCKIDLGVVFVCRGLYCCNCWFLCLCVLLTYVLL